MIPVLRSIDDINVVVRRFLIRQSEVDEHFVRDVKTLFGPSLDKSEDDIIFESIEHEDVMILFELLARKSDSDMTQTLEDGSVISYKSFVVHIIIYGDDSAYVAEKLVARFGTQKVRSDLQSNAIHLEEISEITELHEFKASTIWKRNDFDIDISCNLLFSQINDDYEVVSLSSLNIVDY